MKPAREWDVVTTMTGVFELEKVCVQSHEEYSSAYQEKERPIWRLQPLKDLRSCEALFYCEEVFS